MTPRIYRHPEIANPRNNPDHAAPNAHLDNGSKLEVALG